MASNRFAKLLCLGFVAAAALGCPAHAQDADQSLRLYAVHVMRVPKEPWTGYGIYLGNGVVVTAAHVAGSSLFHKVQVEIAGRDLPANILRKANSGDVDLTVLSVDERQLPVSLRLRRMTVCKDPRRPARKSSSQFRRE